MTLPGLVRANNLNDVVDRERAWDNLGSSLATGDISIPAPSLDLNFAANKSLVDDISGNNLITFSRASTGTFVGSNGLLQTAASGVPRFDHNGATGESLGLLVEEARTNQLIYSQDFAGNFEESNAVITANAGVSLDGQPNATKLSATTSNTSHYVYLSDQSTTSPRIVSLFVKAAEYSRVWIGTAISITGPYVSFDLTSNTVLQTAGSLVSGSARVEDVANGWKRISFGTTETSTSRDNFMVGLIDPNATTTYRNGDSWVGTAGHGVLIWGGQIEPGAFPTSYIPTTGSQVTRAADVASMTGTNFSSWYNQSAGTVMSQCISVAAATNKRIFDISDGSNNNSFRTNILNTGASLTVTSGGSQQAYLNVASSVTAGVRSKQAAAYKLNDFAYSVGNGSIFTDVSGVVQIPNQLSIGSTHGSNQLNGTIARLTYWPSRLNNVSLQYITQSSITAINLYAFNYAINGKDVLALNAVRNASTRNFIFIKGLLSAAQPRLTTAAASTSSALTLATNALPKLSPTSSGNYFFASGITLSGVTTRINGTNALSIATSPFSGSTATAPLLFRELRPQANWRFTEPMPSGTIASPEFAIPFETNDFVLFMKAGPN